jgi:hypothetical protein
MYFRNRVLLILLVLLLVSCQTEKFPKPLPTPSTSCPSQFEWRGLRPGVSTNFDVIRVLGLPNRIKWLKYDNKRVTAYSYKNGEGYLNGVLETRILLRRDGVVDWIEIAASQRDIHFRSVKEIHDLIGDVSLDTIYTNNNYNPAYRMFDMLGGPGIVYVWSVCGLAVIGLPYHSIDQDQQLYPISKEGIDQKESDLKPLYLPPMNEGDELPKTSESAVLLEVLFTPTTYEGFKENYQFQFTWLSWSLWTKIKGYK